MDLIVWTRIITPLAILIFVIYVVISANRLDKRITQQKADAKYQVKTNTDPNSIDNFDQPFHLSEEQKKKDEKYKETELQRVTKKINKQLERATKVDKTFGSTPPVPVDSPSKPIPVTSLLEMSQQTFRNGIILSEILGRPISLRGR